MTTDVRSNTSCDGTRGCITCADEGIPMRVTALPADGAGLAWCADAAGNQIEVMTLLVGPVSPGDTLLVHAGTALVRLAPMDADANVREATT